MNKFSMKALMWKYQKASELSKNDELKVIMKPQTISFHVTLSKITTIQTKCRNAFPIPIKYFSPKTNNKLT